MQYDDNAEKYGYEGEMTPLKCDKLQSYKGDVTIPVYGTIADAKVYLKKEADAVIAELKAALNEAEEARYEAGADAADYYQENRKLKHALWLARAERAKEKEQLFHFSSDFEKLCIDGFYDPYSGRKEKSPKQWIKVFNTVEIKCLKKAEEYR